MIPDPSLPLTTLTATVAGLFAVTQQPPWEMPAEAVLWVQPGLVTWEPGPAHVFLSAVPIDRTPVEAVKTKPSKPKPAGPSNVKAGLFDALR